MNCPNCGAAMRLKDDADYLLCEYCATPHFPDPNADGVRVLGVPAAVFWPFMRHFPDACFGRPRAYFLLREVPGDVDCNGLIQ